MRSMPVASRSAGNNSSGWPMPYQSYSLPPRPCRPNSGYSWGNTGGSEVQKEWATCKRCMVSADPSSPDWTTIAPRQATMMSTDSGSDHQRRNLASIAQHSRTIRRRAEIADFGRANHVLLIGGPECWPATFVLHLG